jgi:uncharacterized membrane protein
VARLFSIKPALSFKGRKFKGIRGFAGKPFHPPLTDIPVACYILAAVFDLISYYTYRFVSETSTVARDFFISGTHVLVAGLIVSVPTALTGFWDWLKSTPKHTQARRTANWHMTVMFTVTAIVAVDILVRLANWDAGYAELAVLILSLVAGGFVAFGALYGGQMVYDFAFNVEQDFDHAYEESETDRVPGVAQESTPP